METLPPLERKIVAKQKPLLSYVGNRLLLCRTKDQEKVFRGKLKELCVTEESRVQAMKQVREVELEGQWKKALHHRQAKQWLSAAASGSTLSASSRQRLSGPTSGDREGDRAISSHHQIPVEPKELRETYPLADLYSEGEDEDHPSEADPIATNSNGEVLLFMDQVRIEHSRVQVERAQAKQWVVEMHRRLIHEERALRQASVKAPSVSEQASQSARLWVKYRQQADAQEQLDQGHAQRVKMMVDSSVASPLIMHDRDLNGRTSSPISPTASEPGDSPLSKRVSSVALTV